MHCGHDHDADRELTGAVLAKVRSDCGCREGECESKPAGCRMQSEVKQRTLAALVLELAEAVDNAHDDIGGSRPQLTILREAVAEARRVRSAS